MVKQEVAATTNSRSKEIQGEQSSRSKRCPPGADCVDRTPVAATPDQKEQVGTSEKTPSPPTLEDIRRRAYEIYCDRNGRPGDALGDWLAAEAELLVSPGVKCQIKHAIIVRPETFDPTC